MDFDEFLVSLSKIKNIPLPAETSQFKMSPPFRRELIKEYKERMKNAKRAGVLAMFYPNERNKTYLALILRKTYKGVHSAQIGFPGGKFEKEDKTLKHTAIRETFEEIGVPEHKIKVIKQMTEVYIPPSNFYVQPFIGITPKPPKFIKQDEEVEDIVEVSLSHFLDENNVGNKMVATSYTANIEVPAYELNGHIVWGATAMMLSEIKDVLKTVM
ncbi:NUDIX hydrolase [Pontimicrobium aquaticum]|uniref:CoA pyrophosphatase n=1 Tax=Pontimicrobium aquaticum TaxID=2565367 RepID=A0A4U0EWD5_9FLAO|nr:CoA pyrophosphatase [Pontimicrobium aquaticum]TJY36225.1 CoA pyrophosphatase [Pontimicrobium aquaticum]